MELQVEDGLGLDFAQRELRHQAAAGFRGVLRRADQLDDRIQIIQGNLVTEQEVFPLTSFPQVVLGAAADHVRAVVIKDFEGFGQSQHARLPDVDRQQDHPEARLHLGLLVEIVQDHFGLLAALQLENDAHSVAVALVADVGDAFDLLVLDQLGGPLDQPRLVDLIRNLRDDDLLAILAHVLDRGPRPHHERSSAGAVRFQDSCPPVNKSAGRKIRPGNHLHQLVERRLGMLDQLDRGVDDPPSDCAAGSWWPCRRRCLPRR